MTGANPVLATSISSPQHVVGTWDRYQPQEGPQGPYGVPSYAGLGLAYCGCWNEAKVGGDSDFSGLVRKGVVLPLWLWVQPACLPGVGGPHAVLWLAARPASQPPMWGTLEVTLQP